MQILQSFKRISLVVVVVVGKQQQMSFLSTQIWLQEIMYLCGQINELNWCNNEHIYFAANWYGF